MQLSAYSSPQSKTMMFRAPLKRFWTLFLLLTASLNSKWVMLLHPRPSTSTDSAILNTQSTSTPSPSLPDKPSTASTDDHSAPPATIYKKKNCRKPTKENLSELISENRLIPKPPLRIEEVIKQFDSLKNNIEVVNLLADNLIKCWSPIKTPKIAIEFDNNNVDNSEYCTTSAFNNVVRSQVEFFFILHENIRSLGTNFD